MQRVSDTFSGDGERETPKQLRFLRSRGAGVLFPSLLVVMAAACRAPHRLPETAPEAPLTEQISPDPNRTVRLAEPLVAIGRPMAGETESLIVALKDIKRGHIDHDYSALENWLERYPNSPWSIAVLTNLGLLNYSAGYFSRALEALERAWQKGRAATGLHESALVDRAVGELAQMHARLGNVEALDNLFAELEDRPLKGSATVLVTNAREALMQMREEPEISFMCGPRALGAVASRLDNAAETLRVLSTVESGPRGTTLAELSALASSTGIGYSPAFRVDKGAIPLPAVVHWKVDHFAAIVDYQDGKYHIVDPTFGDDLWVTQAAIDAESSGYFLVADTASMEGWRPASPVEVRAVRGKGTTTANDPDRVTPEDEKECCESPMPGGHGLPRYSIHSMLVSLNIEDTPIAYSPPVGPEMRMTVTYNQRESDRPAFPQHTNLGPKWTFNWLSYIVDDPTNLGKDVKHFVPGGGWRTHLGYDANQGTFATESQTQAQLVRTSTSPIRYELHLADGSIEVYAEEDGGLSERHVYLSERIDAQGHVITIEYDGSQRITGIVDAVQSTPPQRTVIAYDAGQTGDAYRVHTITDPFNRVAQFGYSGGHLTSITDPEAITATFSYLSTHPDVVEALHTPYGDTSFDYCDVDINPGTCGITSSSPDGDLIRRRITVTDPDGERERVEMRHYTESDIASEATGADQPPAGMDPIRNQFLHLRNTLVWNKQAMRTTSATVADAKIIHWLHGSMPSESVTAAVKESEKQPLENRIRFQYPNQRRDPLIFNQSPILGYLYAGSAETPIRIGRRQPDGTSQQVYEYRYNERGKVIYQRDPTGLETAYRYASNGWDLLSVQRPAAGLSSVTDDLTSLSSDWVIRDFASGTPGTAIPGGGGATLTSDGNFINESDSGLAVCRRIEARPGTTMAYEVTMSTANLGTVPNSNHPLFMLRSSLDDGSPYIQIRRAGTKFGLVQRALVGTFPITEPSSKTYDASQPATLKFTFDGVYVRAYASQPGSALTQINSSTETDTAILLQDARWICLPGTLHGPKTYTNFSMQVPNYDAPLAQFTYNNQHQPLTYTDAASKTTVFTYNAAGQVTSMTDAESVQTSWHYDSLGYLESIDHGLDDEIVVFSYDSAGRVETRTNGLGRTLTYAYDNLDRVRTVTYPDSISKVTPSVLPAG